MTIVERPLTNHAFGYPTRGARRRINPIALACIHITANERTASYTDLHAAADAERDYANRASSGGPSAHYYVARDGWAIEAIDPVLYAAWSNGDVNAPNRDNAGIQKVLALRAKGYNANECYVLEIENVGNRPEHPVTEAQKRFCAEVIAREAKRTGLPINRNTVHAHADINSIDRAGCPAAPKNREDFLGDIIHAANLILNPPPPPAPTPEPTYTKAQLDAAVKAATDPLTAKIADLEADITVLQAEIVAESTEDAEVAADLRAQADKLDS